MQSSILRIIVAGWYLAFYDHTLVLRYDSTSDCSELQGGKRSGKRYTSRCHVHDICQILIASMVSPKPGEIYNVADDDPSSRETVMDYACNHFKLVKPRQEDQQQRKVTRYICSQILAYLEKSTKVQ